MNEFTNDQPLDFGIAQSTQTEKLEVNDDVTRYWMQTAGWFTFMGAFLFFIILVIVLAMRSALSSLFGLNGVWGMVLGLVALVTTVPAILYWRAGSRIRLGFMRSETEEVERGFKHLLWIYRFNGILVILYFLLLIGVFIFGIATAFGNR